MIEELITRIDRYGPDAGGLTTSVWFVMSPAGHVALKHCDNEAMQDITEGRRRLEAAGIPVVPVLERAGNWWLEPVVAQVNDQASRSLKQAGLDLMYRCLRVGVGDIDPGNTGIYDGELVVIDTGYLLDLWSPDENDALCHYCEQQWYSLDRELGDYWVNGEIVPDTIGTDTAVENNC